MASFATRQWLKRESPGASGFLVRATASALALLAGLVAPSPAASPRDDLLALAPEDAGFCLIVNDLRGHTEKLRASNWVKSLAESPYAKELLQSPEARQLLAAKERLQKRLKISLDRLRDDILGDAVVFAYRLGPPDKPDQDQGLVLLWARDARLLTQVIEILNADLKEVQTRVHKNLKYVRRVEARGNDNYYYVDGSLLAFSTKEEVIRQVIDRILQQKARGNRTAGFLVEQLYRLGADKALAVVLLNPRAFDEHVRKSLTSSKDSAAFLYKSFFRYWQALEVLALSVSIPDDFEIKLAVKANPEKLPEPLRRFLTEASRPSELWRYFPSNALVAMAGRIDAVALADLLGDFLPAGMRQALAAKADQSLKASLDLDLTRDILPNLGPDLGFCITSPADTKILTPHVTGALRVRPGTKEKKVDRELFNGLNMAAVLISLSSSGTKEGPVKLRTAKQDQVEIKYLENDKLFPAGVKPAFALKEGYLLLATSPEAIRSFGKRDGADDKTEDVLLLRVSLKEWSRFLKQRREAFINHFREIQGHTREIAAHQLDTLVWALDLFDRLDLRQRTGSGMVTWTVRIKPAKPVEKTRE
jgi:hypothetical protein